jgi:hypothetical protein
VLGRGAQAETLWAEDTATQTQVAIKRFQVRGARSWKDVELAEREATVLSRLNHPGLPKYISHFEEDGALYLVMEKIEGVTLAELRERRALDQATVARFLHDLAGTLSYLHGLSPPIVHRDIKPQNVILRPDGGFSLVDFGSVREKLRPEGGSTVVGTFGYMAPEQFQGRAGPATDVYGAGVTAIACLSGCEPEHLPHRGLAIDVPSALGAHVDRAWVELLTHLVEPDPDKRPRALGPALSATLGRRRHAAAMPTSGRSEATTGSGRAARKQARRAEKRALREARRERKAARRAARVERGHEGFLTRPQRIGVVLVFVAGFFALRGGLLGALLEVLPILLCGLAILFAVRGFRRRAARNAAEAKAEAEQSSDDWLERAEQDFRVNDLLERAQRALDERPAPERARSRVPERQRIDDPNPSDAERDAAGVEHPLENHRNSRISR